MIMTLEEIASRINGQLQGDGSVEITGINNITGARAGDITFADENHVEEAKTCQATAILLPAAVKEAQQDFPLPAVFQEAALVFSFCIASFKFSCIFLASSILFSFLVL